MNYDPSNNTFNVFPGSKLKKLAEWLKDREYNRAFHDNAVKSRGGNPAIILQMDSKRVGCVVCQDQTLWEDVFDTVHHWQAYSGRLVA